MKTKKIIALLAALTIAMSFAACTKNEAKETDAESKTVSVSAKAADNKQTESSEKSDNTTTSETSASDKKVSSSETSAPGVPKNTDSAKKDSGKKTTAKKQATTKKQTTTKKKTTTKKQTATKKQESINPAEIQREINNYIASKGWEVNSSLTPSNAGWSDKISINGDLSTKKYIIDNLKWLVDEFPPSFGKYCYFDGKYFYVLYD